ncbi:type IV secretion system DNA-binding domain-containing protein [Candidatus Parcubacteria bacterium]|nr:type IV secretion system DNA-binding domain-containing protein [Candidatus Parcubacteria bacterium]
MAFELLTVPLDLSFLLWLILITLAVLTVGGTAAAWGLVTLRRRGETARALNLALFAIALPNRPLESDRSAVERMREGLAVMSQFYASLTFLKEKWWRAILRGMPTVAFELAVPHVGEEIQFFAAFPRRLAEAFEKHIHGFFPEAVIEAVPDYNLFNPHGRHEASILEVKNSRLSLRTFRELEVDPLSAIATALSKIAKEGEGAAIQILLQPAPKRWGAESVAQAQKLKANSTRGPGESKNEPVDPEAVEAIERKARTPVFAANVRVVASAAEETRAKALLEQMETAFAPLSAPPTNSLSFKRRKGGRLESLLFAFSWRLFRSRDALILSADELSSMYHFATPSLEAPKLHALKARQAEPPLNLPLEGLMLGRNVFRGRETVIRIAREDRRRHLYIIGQTGTGKSSLIKELARQDIEAGEGLALIDPHGDLADDLLGLVPASRREEVIYFNPGDIERPLGLNMLEYDPAHPEQKTFIANELIAIFDKLYDLKVTGGPMFEQYMRNAVLLVMEDPASGNTLLEIPRVLADKEFRKLKLSRTTNMVIKNFWELEAEKAGGEAALANMVPYITSKMNLFIANDIMRPIIAQEQSSFNFRQVMDERKILLVNLTKGRLGELNSSLLGLILVGKLLLAALSRTDAAEEARSDFYLYLDEFQSFATPSIATILSEARKYRLNLTLAHQFIKQLTDEIKNAVFGNVGSLVSFRVGVEDAESIEPQFAPAFAASDLINLDNFNAYARLMSQGKTTSPFNFVINLPRKGDPAAAHAVRQWSSSIYGRDRAAVEQEVRTRLSQMPALTTAPPTEQGTGR